MDDLLGRWRTPIKDCDPCLLELAAIGARLVVVFEYGDNGSRMGVDVESIA